MDQTVLFAAVGVAVVVVAAAAFFFIGRKLGVANELRRQAQAQATAEESAKRIIAEAGREADTIRKSALLSGKEELMRSREEWEAEAESTVELDALLPALDVWLDVPLGEIQHVVHILPTLDWSGGLLGVRLKYQIKDMGKLRAEYVVERAASGNAATTGPAGEHIKLAVWPLCLTDFLERRLRAHLELAAFPLDPRAVTLPGKCGLAVPQDLPASALRFDHPPFKDLVKIDEIAAQRDFADAGDREGGDDKAEVGVRRFKRRLSDQLRSYYDRHLDPSKTPTDKDYEALGAIQAAERSFDSRLESGFAAAFEELEDLGYPGMSNPKLKISTLLRATDGLKHGSSVQYQVADPSGH